MRRPGAGGCWAWFATGTGALTALRRRSLRLPPNPFSDRIPRHSQVRAVAMEARVREPPCRGQSPPARRKRAFCARCSKPASVCLCTRFRSPPLENSVGVTILQHSLEGKHALNSARVASLGLRNVAVVPVTDVLFHAEFTVRPLCRGPTGPAVAGGGQLGKVSAAKASNVAALGVGVLGMALGSHALDGDGGDADVHLREGSSDGERSKDVGSLDDAFIGEKATNGGEAAAQKRCRSEDSGSSQEDCKNLASNSNSENGILAGVSASPMRQAFTKRISDSQFQPRASEAHPHEKSSGDGGEATVTSELCKVVCFPSHLRVSLERTSRPDLSWVLGKPFGKAARSNGFVVQKLQRGQLKGIEESEDREEFELVIPPGSALLFPGKSSIEVGAVDFAVKHLVVLDGTWDKAKRMYYENPWLQFLPLLKLEPRAESLYSEVRHQPRAGCLSTIESIVYALKSLGNDIEGLDNLLDVFKSMIGDQRRCKDEKFSRMSQP